MKYALVYSKDFRKLERVVNERMDEGWKLIGGVSGGTRIYCQAMTREDTPEEIAQAQIVADQQKAVRLAQLQNEENADVDSGSTDTPQPTVTGSNVPEKVFQGQDDPAEEPKQQASE